MRATGEPLSPRPALPGLAWLRGARTSRLWTITHASVCVALTVGLGTWGFERLAVNPKLTFPQSVYRALKLYAVDLGPAGGGSATAGGRPVGPNWQIVIAFAAALFLLARALVALTREHLRRAFVQHLLSGHVIVCGGGVHGSRLVEELATEHDVVLVDADPAATGMQAPFRDNEWRLIGDATEEETLIRAGVKRAHWIIAVTGDDYRSSQIVSGVDKLDVRRHGMRVLVQVEDPSLARFLEEGEHRDPDDEQQSSKSTPATFLTVIGGNAVAAGALFGERRASDDTEAPKPLADIDQTPGHLLLAGDHALLDALVLATLRRARARKLRAEEGGADAGDGDGPRMRITLIGPRALERVDRLVERWRPEPELLELEARDIVLGDERALHEDRWLRERRTPGHVVVACENELDGVGLTLAISRAVGDGVPVTRVTAQPESALDARLEEHTRRNRYLARTDVESIAKLAWGYGGIHRVFMDERLLIALGEHVSAGGETREQKVAQVHALLGDGRVDIYSNAAPQVTAGNRILLEAVLDAAAAITADSEPANKPGSEAVPLHALVGAGLAIHLESSRNLRSAARWLSVNGDSHQAFAAWCEYARLAPAEEGEDTRLVRDAEWLGDEAKRLAHDAARLTDQGEPQAAKDAQGGADKAHDAAELAGAVLRLRATQIGVAGSGDDRHGLLAGVGFPAPEPGPLLGADLIVIFAGGSGSVTGALKEEIRTLLNRALMGLDAVILTGGTEDGVPGAVRAAATHNRVPIIGYAPRHLADPGIALRHTQAPTFSEREPLAMWSDILKAGISAARVRLVAFPGHEITDNEILLARALGARVSWIPLAEYSPQSLDEILPQGGERILELPIDPMTLRAFLQFGNGPELDADLRGKLARLAHEDYVEKQRKHKHPDDPALAPWGRLSPAIRHSNLAQAEDLPKKLALIGKCIIPLDQGGHALQLTAQELELLAEIEHGRYNFERLSTGWQLGRRDVARFVSPYLTPWDELDEETKQWDRDAVNNIAPALAALGWGVQDRSAGGRYA